MQWVAHTSAEGRPYWFNAGTNKSVWEKPDELKTPLELQLSQLAWKEYETGGRKYWVHNTSKETTWECPPEITAFLAKAYVRLPATPLTPSIPTGPAADTPKATLPPAHPSLPLTPSSGALVAPGGYMPGLPSRPVPLTSQYLPDLNIRDAEGAFVDMLRRVGVTPKWTWEQTMREIITEPMYKALKTLAERKAAFEKFVADTIADEAATRQRSLDKNRKQFFSALNKLGGGVDREGGVKTWWNWDVRKEELEAKIPDAWKGLRNDEERRTLFSEFIANTKEKDLVRAFDVGKICLLPVDAQERGQGSQRRQARCCAAGTLARPRGHDPMEGRAGGDCTDARVAHRHGAAEDRPHRRDHAF